VHGEVIADLRRQAADSSAFNDQRVPEHLVDRRQQPVPFVGRELREHRVRRQHRVVQHVVGVASADAGHGALVAQNGVDATRVVAPPDPRRERVRQHLGTEDGQRTLVALREHPPACLALLPELLHEN
jgi:hypothetical protein